MRRSEDEVPARAGDDAGGAEVGCVTSGVDGRVEERADLRAAGEVHGGAGGDGGVCGSCLGGGYRGERGEHAGRHGTSEPGRAERYSCSHAQSVGAEAAAHKTLGRSARRTGPYAVADLERDRHILSEILPLSSAWRQPGGESCEVDGEKGAEGERVRDGTAPAGGRSVSGPAGGPGRRRAGGDQGLQPANALPRRDRRGTRRRSRRTGTEQQRPVAPPAADRR